MSSGLLDDWSNMKEEVINQMLDTGMDLVSKNGFNKLGLNELVKNMGIPKGSFYYYFSSKDDFGLQVIDHYAGKSEQLLKSFLEDTSKTPKERILTLFRHRIPVYEEQEYKEGCLLGNCSLELSAQKEEFAIKIADRFDQWEHLFVKAIAEGQEDGSIKSTYKAEVMAQFILNSWEGAVLRMKSAKTNEAMEIFIRFVDDLL